jgi:hypothetical protein
LTALNVEGKAKQRLNTTHSCLLAIRMDIFMSQSKCVSVVMGTDTSVILTTRPDGVYVWQDGKLIGYLPAASCLNFVREILNKVDL